MNHRELFYSPPAKELADNICDLARECWSLRLSDTTGFSISAKIPGTSAILVDKSGTGFRRNRITHEDLILYDEDGELLYSSERSENERLAPVNTLVHLGGYRASSRLRACIHFHDPFIAAFAGNARAIRPFTLQSKTIGEVPCLVIDDRKEKTVYREQMPEVRIPSGIHGRPDVAWVMQQVADEAEAYIRSRADELDTHGIAVTHYEHGLFAWGRHLDEAFDNAYRVQRNAQATIYSSMLGGE